MTTATKAPARVACEYEGCKYSAEPGSSIAGHVAMAHPDVPMDAVAPKRSARNDEAPKPQHRISPAASQAIAAFALAENGLPALLELPLDVVDVGANVRVDVAELEELAASIAEHGVLQPIKATGPHADGRYRVVWGQRRVLASRQAGRTTIAALVVAPAADVDDTGATRSVEQLVENLHRADLNPIDRARAMREVVDSGISQADLARKLGLAPSTVANDLRLLELDPKVTEAIAGQQLSAGHGKALVGLAPSTQRELVAQAVRDRVSAHGMESLVAQHKRSEEWRKERETAERKRVEEAREAQQASIARLATKKVPTDARILVGGGYDGNGQEGHVADLIRKAGYTNVAVTKDTLSPRPKGGGCDCTAWKVEIKYDGGLTIAQACTSKAHTRAVAQADEAARLDAYANGQRVHALVEQLAPAMVSVSPFADRQLLVDTRLARMLLWELLGYGVADWAAAHGGKRNHPWAAIAALTDTELVEELGKKIAHDFRDQYSYKVDWSAVEAELRGPEAPAR